MKTIAVTSRTMPDWPAVYGDSLSIHEDNEMLGHWDGSACPNGSRKEPGTGRVLKYYEAYGWLAPGSYPAQCVQHDKYGKCLLLAGGGKLPARYINPNRKAKYFGTPFVSAIFVHKGFSRTCRGSAACVTAHPEQYGEFIGKFVVGEAVEIKILDMLTEARWRRV